ncbi:MAG: hypothetical protein K1W17_03830 [Oscillospiraceae bacterium]
MAVYLVDFENVSSAGISGIQKLTKEDKVYIFYTVNASNMSFAAHLNLLSSPAEVVYYNVASGGKNALDFQLASFLGYLICQGKDKKFCIISNDRGFEYVKTFWERNGAAADISIYGAPSINRSLLAAEKPFAARIQQNTAAPSVQPPTEEFAVIGEEAVSSEKVEMAKAAETAADAIEAERAAEKPAPKKRGRPRNTLKQEKKEEAKGRKPEKTAKTESASESKKNEAGTQSIKQQKKEPAKSKSETKPVSGAGEIPPSLKGALSKAGIIDDAEIRNVLGLLKSAEGKQQFYRGILKFFGMERGVEVYKAVRPEYTNLTKLVKQ